MHIATAEAVGTFSRPKSIICTLEECLKATAEYYKLTPKELRGNATWQPLARRRLLMIFIMRTTGGYSFPHIARFLARHHTTVMYACRKMQEGLTSDADLVRDHAAIIALLQRA